MARPFYIDDDECIGDGCCAEICPGCFVFEQGMEIARVISFDCEDALVEEAMEACPAQCIHYDD